MENRILIIDDEVQYGEILKDAIAVNYPHTTFISNPEDAVAAIHEDTYNLIISDVMMPGLQGPDLIKKIRGKGKLTPVIFATAYADKSTLLTALRLGAADVLEKPFEENELLGSIDRIFEIEKRRLMLVLNSLNLNPDPLQLEKQQKMLGLLIVKNASPKKPAV